MVDLQGYANSHGLLEEEAENKQLAGRLAKMHRKEFTVDAGGISWA